MGKDAHVSKLERAIRLALELAERFGKDGYTTMEEFWSDAVIELQDQAVKVRAS